MNFFKDIFGENPGEGGINNVLNGILDGDSPLPPAPPVVPPALPPPALAEKCREWLIENRIDTVNYIMRRYPVERVFDAIEDYERATDRRGRGSSAFMPRDKTAYFRSLLR